YTHVQPIPAATICRSDEDVAGHLLRPPTNNLTLFPRRIDMSRTAVAHAQNEIVQQACSDASAVQDAVNLVAIVGSFHRHLLALRQAGVFGDDLNNHPVALVVVSKFNSLCRMSLDREIKAFEAIDRLQRGEDAEFEVLPL